MFRRRSATETKNLLEYLARAQREQDHRRGHALARAAAADAMNADLAVALHRLESLLAGSLAVDTYIDLDSLKKTTRIPAFDKPEPNRRSYFPEPPSALASLAPWKKRAYDRQFAAAESRYEQERREYEAALHDHQEQALRTRAEAERHNEEIERYILDFAAGEPTAIAEYFGLVLDRSPYPAGFPKSAKVVYQAESKTLRVEFLLPHIDIVPAQKAYEYDELRDEIRQTAMAQERRRRLYSSALAQISLRAVHELFTADRMNKIERLAFAGYVDALHPGSGQRSRFCLVAFKIMRLQFERLDLRHIEPRACLQVLNARLLSKPDQLSSAPSMPQDDILIETSAEANGGLDDRGQVGEREGAAETLKAQMTPLESRLAARRDKTAELESTLRDSQAVIAEMENRLEAQAEQIDDLEASLQEEQARNADLIADVQAQRNYIIELESAIHARTDTVAALEDELAARGEGATALEHEAATDGDHTESAEEAAQSAEEDDLESAAVFAPAIDEPEDDAGGDPIPSRAPEADEPVTLRDLLQGTASIPANSHDKATTPSANCSDVAKLRECIDCLGEAEARLLTLLMRSGDWTCSEASLQSALPGRPYIRSIIDNINDPLYDLIGENLIEEDNELLAVGEDYRDALEAALKTTDNQYIRIDSKRG